MQFMNRKVTPSYLNTRAMGRTSPAATHHATRQLMMGEVQEIIEPTSDRSLSKLYKEYNVAVQYREGSGPVSSVVFPNCVVMSVFGGISDRFSYTLRVDTKEPEQQQVMGAGSKVLLLCLNGSSSETFIVGGIREDQIQDETGHNMFWEFNGFSCLVDKEGQATIEHRGPTKADGSLDTDAGAAEAAGPTGITFLKNGNLEFYTKDQSQLLRLDHENEKATFVLGQWFVDAKEIHYRSEGEVSIESTGVKIGAATDNTMMGSTFRQAQQTLNNQLMSGLSGLAGQLAAAAAACGAIAFGTGVGVAAALGSAVTSVTQMVTALTTFEAQAARYLSTKNKSD